jgi:hypothetical protein
MQVIKRGDGFWLKVANDENGPFRSVRDCLETYQECYDMADVSIEDLAVFAGVKVEEVAQ